jgi:hypothetical protein
MYQCGPFDILHTAKEGHIFQECPCNQGINWHEAPEDACWSAHSALENALPWVEEKFHMRVPYPTYTLEISIANALGLAG